MSNVKPTSDSASPGTSSRSPAEKISEAEFLAQEAAQARAALTRVAMAIKSDAGRVVDPRVWAQRYPFASVLAACAAGALLAPDLRADARSARRRKRRSVYRRGAALARRLLGSQQFNILKKAVMAPALAAVRHTISERLARASGDGQPAEEQAAAGIVGSP